MNRSFYSNRVLSVAVIVIAALAGDAFATSTFVNTTSIAIPAPGSSNGTSISVTGIGNSITSLAVEMKGFSETDISDVGLVLVGPTGAALSLMGDCGGGTQAIELDLTITDAAGTEFPSNTPIASGSYKPTQFGSLGSFPSPGPGLAYSSPATFGSFTFLSTFQGTNPNGTWSLYAIDPVSGDSGEISNGWNIQINAVPEPGSLSLLAIGATGLLRRRRRL